MELHISREQQIQNTSTCEKELAHIFYGLAEIKSNQIKTWMKMIRYWKIYIKINYIQVVFILNFSKLN